MASYVDLDRLAELTRAKRGNRGLREVVREIGNISPSTLSRVENSKMPDMETFLRLCDWLQIPATDLIKNSEGTNETKPDTVDAITAQLRAARNIDPETANALAHIITALYQDAMVRTNKDDGNK